MVNIQKIITIGSALILLLAYSGAATLIKIDAKGNLVDGDGWTLYYFSNDGPNMISTCYGSCSETWNPFYAKEISIEGDLHKNDFDTIIREDGLKQTSYKNWPLYRYSKDSEPGKTDGHNSEGLWFVVKPGVSPFI
jgi:predicted lipoprotein with Yx(FWY)xxD motif